MDKLIAACFLGFLVCGGSCSNLSAQDGSITINADKVSIRDKGQITRVERKAQGAQAEVFGLDITEPADHVELGYGYDVFSGEIIPTKCVEGIAMPDSTIGNMRGDPSTAIKSVTSLSEMRSQSGTSAEGSLTYKAFSAGYAGSQYRSDFFRSYYAYVVTNLKVVNKTELFEPQRLAPNGKTALAQKRLSAYVGKCMFSPSKRALC